MAAHGGLAGHHGVERTLQALHDMGLSWPKIEEDVRTFIRHCVVCQKIKPRCKPLRIGNTLVNLPFWVWSVDAMGPFPCSGDGYIYILAITCCFTRWLEFVPLRTLSAEEAATALLHTVFLRHGLPKYLKSDRGTQFVNELITKLLDTLGIRRFRILPYSPQSNGVIERSNRETLKHLKCLLYDFNKPKPDWPSLLPMVMYIINHSINSSTGHTPHTLLYGHNTEDLLVERLHEAVYAEVGEPAQGPSPRAEQTQGHDADAAAVASRRPRKRLQEIFPELFVKEGGVVENKTQADEYLDALRGRLALLRDRAAKLQEAQMIKRNQGKNRGSEDRSFAAGDFVILLDAVRTDKLQAAALGPYKVLEARPDVRGYKIASIVNPSKTYDVHARMLLPLEYTQEDLQMISATASHDEGEMEVADIVGHEVRQAGRTRRLMLHIKWADGSQSWEPWTNARNDDKAEEHMRVHKLRN